jgi:hypothetical protein
LCQIYTKTYGLDPGTVSEDGRRVCVISRDRIIGREEFPDVEDKILLRTKQLQWVAEKEDVRPVDVWRVEDMYSPKQNIALRDAGFPIQFVVPGYVFPFDLIKMKEDPNIRVLDRSNFAAQLGGLAEAWRC